MESKYTQFLNYNFDENLEWKNYLNSIPENQRLNQLNMHKKLFYKNKIDNSFDINYNPSKVDIEFYIYICETIILLFFIICSIFYTSSSLSICLISFIIRFLRMNWPLQFNKQYLEKILPQDIFGFIIYCLIINFTTNFKVYIYLISPIITSVLYIIGFQRRHNQYFPQILTNYILKIRNHQDKLLQFRLTKEILILPISIFGIFFGFNSFILPIMYFQFLKMRLNLDLKLQNSLNEIKLYLIRIQSSFNNFLITSIISKLILVCDILRK